MYIYPLPLFLSSLIFSILTTIKPMNASTATPSSVENLTFVQKLERRKAKKLEISRGDITRGGDSIGSRSVEKLKKSTFSYEVELPSRSLSPPRKSLTEREKTTLIASQLRSANRLASQNKSEGNLSAVGEPKEFICSDGITKMPYMVLGLSRSISFSPSHMVSFLHISLISTLIGSISLESKRDNFIVIHDFFDTLDATAIFLKPIVQRHDGCQILCFNYPGQANTTWPRPPAAEKHRGAKDITVNNDWIADKIHGIYFPSPIIFPFLISSYPLLSY